MWSRAKKRKAQLISGEGDPEPVRSRNNSVCHSSVKRKDNPVLQLGSNPEADANEFLLTAGGLGKLLSCLKTKAAIKNIFRNKTELFPIKKRTEINRIFFSF